MAIAAPTIDGVLTRAEIIEKVGDIPVARIFLKPVPGTATERDVLDLDAHQDLLCELVNGILVKKPMGFLESRIAILLARILDEYLDRTGLGVTAGEAGMLRLTSNNIRIPDASFFLW